MIIVRVKGGLGNQLFQYALGYSLSMDNNQELFIDPFMTSNMTHRHLKLEELALSSYKIIDTKKIPYYINFCKNKYVNKVIRVTHGNSNMFSVANYLLEIKETYIEELEERGKKDIYLDGYFQTPIYFKKYRNDLIRQIYPRYIAEKDFLGMLFKIESCESVAIHVRRCDFKKSHCKFHYLLHSQYYHDAIQYIRSKLYNPTFFWFSDDDEWVKNEFGLNDDYCYVNLQTLHADIDELMLMRKCKHIITANSTFSWWAAWLNDDVNAIKIVPSKQYGNTYMIPDNWIRINCE